jgi:hypothetical protein
MMRIYSAVFPDKFICQFWEKLSPNFQYHKTLGEKKTLFGLSKGQTKRKESRKIILVVLFLAVNSINFAIFFGKYRQF